MSLHMKRALAAIRVGSWPETVMQVHKLCSAGKELRYPITTAISIEHFNVAGQEH